MNAWSHKKFLRAPLLAAVIGSFGLRSAVPWANSIDANNLIVVTNAACGAKGSVFLRLVYP